MKGEIELYNISFLILKVNLHFNIKIPNLVKKSKRDHLKTNTSCFQEKYFLKVFIGSEMCDSVTGNPVTESHVCRGGI